MTAARRRGDNQLAAVEARLITGPDRPLTLASDRMRARLPSELVGVLLESSDPARFEDALVEGMSAVYGAILRAFPSNLLWDLDALFSALVRSAREHPDPARALRDRLAGVAALQDVFGRGPVNFSYIHDFIYGFDWAKWVGRSPDARAGVGPFDPAFIEAMRVRGAELLQTIADSRDQKYPPLPAGRPRNPFPFSRTPAAELRLHRELAARDLLPVKGWSVHDGGRWDRPYADLRCQVAAELGLERQGDV